MPTVTKHTEAILVHSSGNTELVSVTRYPDMAALARGKAADQDERLAFGNREWALSELGVTPFRYGTRLKATIEEIRSGRSPQVYLWYFGRDLTHLGFGFEAGGLRYHDVQVEGGHDRTGTLAAAPAPDVLRVGLKPDTPSRMEFPVVWNGRIRWIEVMQYTRHPKGRREGEVDVRGRFLGGLRLSFVLTYSMAGWPKKVAWVDGEAPE